MTNKENVVSQQTTPKYQQKKDKSYRFLTAAVLAFFTGLVLCVAFYSYTLINIFQLSKFFVGFTVVGFLIPLKYYQKWFHFIKYETIIFNIIGIGPFLTGLFLFINFTFSSNPFTHQYKIEKLYFEGEQDYKSIGVVLEENMFSKERKIVELTRVSPNEVFSKQFLKVTIAEGLFGYQVIKEKELVN